MMDQQANQTTVVVGDSTGDGRVIATPAGEKDLVLKVLTPLAAILIRAAKTYLQTLLGLMTASVSGAASSVLPPGDFIHTLTTCAGLALAAAVMSVLTNLAAFLSSLGDSFPVLKV